LQAGVLKFRKAWEKKRKHTWAYQVMNKLIEHEKYYDYKHGGYNPYAQIFGPSYNGGYNPYPEIFGPSYSPSEIHELDAEENDIYGETDYEHKPGKLERYACPLSE
jgi:hypothetical protein